VLFRGGNANAFAPVRVAAESNHQPTLPPSLTGKDIATTVPAMMRLK
jgi:hypothetical protein